MRNMASPVNNRRYCRTPERTEQQVDLLEILRHAAKAVLQTAKGSRRAGALR